MRLLGYCLVSGQLVADGGLQNVEEVLGRIELVLCFEVEEAGIAIQTVGRELLQVGDHGEGILLVLYKLIIDRLSSPS